MNRKTTFKNKKSCFQKDIKSLQTGLQIQCRVVHELDKVIVKL